MILTGAEIIREWKEGRIVVDPFDEAQVNPNSYNFRLGGKARVYSEFPLDPRHENAYETIEISPQGTVLEPRTLYLCCTEEILGSTHYAPTYAARSSVARLGLFINLSASLGDIGFIGRWTLQLYAIHPLKVYRGMKIGQMMWWRPQGEVRLYDGKYQGSTGPQTTLMYRDFEATLLPEQEVAAAAGERRP